MLKLAYYARKVYVNNFKLASNTGKVYVNNVKVGIISKKSIYINRIL